jgi:hypothetical protein
MIQQNIKRFSKKQIARAKSKKEKAKGCFSNTSFSKILTVLQVGQFFPFK